MQLACKQCGRDIPPDDINIDTLVAKCRACNAVFCFAEEVGAVPHGESRTRPKFDPPPGVTVSDWDGKLKIVRRWFSLKVIGLLFFCTIWDGFLVFWYSLAFKEDAPLMMKLFPLLHVMVGVLLTYSVAAGFVNKTLVEVYLDEMKIRHGPLPWPGNRIIPSQEIDQLFTRERIHRTKNGTNYSYELSMMDKGGKQVKLLSNLENPEQALFFEQQIESYLRIKDRAVAGEIPR